ncbi:MAG: hypothetical protein QJR00_01490 [Bacillota bacterium]|nr:hypothetical protein [Bacillota bacterium]
MKPEDHLPDLMGRVEEVAERAGAPLGEGWPGDLYELSRAFYAALQLEVEGEALPAEEEESPGQEEDPGAEEGPSIEELIQRMEAMESYRPVAEALARYQEEAQKKYRRGRAPFSQGGRDEPSPPALEDLLLAFEDVWKRAHERVRRVEKEAYPLETAMAELKERLAGGPLPFARLFPEKAPRRRVIVLFLALLELIRTGNVVAQGHPLVVSLP